MSIVLIYHHEERARTDGLRETLEQKGYEVQLAPLGFEVGSAEWQARAKADIEAASLVIVLCTVKAADDEWVNWRLQAASGANQPVLPVMLEPCHLPSRLMMYQSMSFTVNSEDTVLDAISKLGITPPVSCFVSYARPDGEFAAKLASSLRENGVKVWRDVDNIPAGVSWDAEIQKALNTCTHLLFIASPASVESPNVADEISFALNKGKTVIPIILANCELPLRVHRAQWVDFQANHDAALAELLRHLGTV